MLDQPRHDHAEGGRGRKSHLALEQVERLRSTRPGPAGKLLIVRERATVRRAFWGG